MTKTAKNKVAILADPLDFQSAGIYVYLVNLISKLSLQNEIEYTLIRAKSGKENYGLKEHILKPYRFPGYALFRKFIQIPLYLRKSSFDAVIEPAHFGPFGNGNPSKKITVIHDLTPLLFPIFHPLYSSILHKLILGRILRNADLIISNSLNTQYDIERLYAFAKNKIQTIYPEVSDIFKKVEDTNILQEYGIHGEYILSVGTIEPRKNYLTLVKAFAGLKEEDPELKIKLIIVGRKGWKSKSLLDHIKKSKFSSDIKIINNAPTIHLPIFYSHCRVFVYPSIYEGYGFPLIEAHNCGASCIAGNNSSLKEIGKSFASFYDTMNEIDLMHKIKKVLASAHPIIPYDFKPIYNEGFSSQFHKEVLKLFLADS